MKRIILCALLVAMEGSAATYRWPYVTSIDVNITSSTSATYALHMQTTTITDDSISDGETVKNVLWREGLAWDAVRWGAYHRHRKSEYHEGVASPTKSDDMSMALSWVSEANRLARRWGAGVIENLHNGGVNGMECVGTGIWDPGKVYNVLWSDWPSRMWNGGVTGACLGTPTVNQWCAMKTPTIEIAYGTLTLKDAEGSNKTAGVTVECTTGMKYTLRLWDANNETTLDNGGRVTWQAGGKAMGETLTGEAGENGVDLIATLHGPFERTGEFHGSGILFVSYP